MRILVISDDTVGERIRKARKIKNISQTELAERIGLPSGENGRIRISQYENGTHTPKEEMLKRMADVLHVDIEWLKLGLINKMPPAAYEMFYSHE